MTARAWAVPLFFALLTPQQRDLNVQSFDHVWTTIRDQHWDPKLGGLDWPAVRDELRPRIEQADSMDKARAVLNDMMKRLGQSHFGIIPAEVYKDIDKKPDDSSSGGDKKDGEQGQKKDVDKKDAEDGSTGIDVRVLTDKVVVTSVEADSPARAQGVRPGWQIAKIKGIEIAPLIDKISATFKDSTLRDLTLTRVFLGRLSGKVGTTIAVELLDGDDKTVALELARVKPRGVKARFGYLPPLYVWTDSRKLEGNIGYVAFNVFLDPANVMARFEEAVRSCLRCDGFLIDLRGNPGGIGAMAMGMAGWFIDTPDQRLGTMYTRQAPLKFVVNPRLETYRGPLAILVDGCSGSTSEVFAGGLKDLKRARIFGTRTAGAALPSVLERLPNGDGFQHAIANYISEGGKPLEGAGVIPDVEVTLTRDALLQGKDSVVEAAVRWIRKTKEKP